MNTPELSHLEYVLANLGRGVDPVSPADYLEKIKLIRQIALDHKMRLMILQPNQQFQQNLSQLWGQVQTQLAKPLDRTRLEEQTSLQKVLARSEAPALRAKLKDQNPQHRLMTVQTIGQRRIPLEAELIERLNDPEPMVRWAVYQALVRLARGADFGPRPNAGKVERARAVAKWRAWLALQEDAPKVNSVPPTEQEAEALKLCATFLQANPKDQLRMLDEWQGQEGEAITMALSGVLADLKSERQAKVRQTLTNRFAALANEAVAEFLTDDDPELRCAAARAIAVKKAEDLIPDLLKTLEDSETAVVQSARASLRKLTGKDFGPEPAGSPLDRLSAIGQWYRWWNERVEKMAATK